MNKKRDSEKENFLPAKNKPVEQVTNSSNNPLLNVKTAKPLTRYTIASDESEYSKKGNENE